MYLQLENALSRKIKKRRIIFGSLSAFFFVILIVFLTLYFSSAETTVTGYGPIEYRSVHYNDNFLWGVMFGVFGFIYSVVFFIMDLIHCKYITVEVNGDYITFYRAMGHVSLYVNGVEKDRISFFRYYLEAPLSDGTMVNVAVGKWSAHMTFTNGHHAMDI